MRAQIGRLVKDPIAASAMFEAYALSLQAQPLPVPPPATDGFRGEEIGHRRAMREGSTRLLEAIKDVRAGCVPDKAPGFRWASRSGPDSPISNGGVRPVTRSPDDDLNITDSRTCRRCGARVAIGCEHTRGRA